MKQETINLTELINTSYKKAIEFINLKKYFHAKVILEQILKVKSDEIEAKKILSIVLNKLRDSNTALKFLNEVLEENPNDDESLNSRGLCYHSLGDFSKAADDIQRAIEINPKSEYYSNLALQTKSVGDNKTSIKLLKKAIEISEKSCYWKNLSDAYIHDFDLKNSEYSAKKAIELGDLSSNVELSRVYFFTKEYEKAWKHYEYRLDHIPQMEIMNKIYPKEKRWNGEDITGKKLIIYNEQGIGDLIQGIRYLKYLKYDYTLIAGEESLSLLKNNGITNVINVIPQEKDYDYQCSLLSLPYLLKINYIPKEFSLKKTVFDLNSNKKYKVGICWAGNPKHTNDTNRSCYLHNFKFLENFSEIELYSLQKDRRLRSYGNNKSYDLSYGFDNMNIIDMSDKMNSLEETAAIISNLDLVISVDTLILHLSGSLGVKTVGLIPYNPDWRWGLNDRDTEWYESVILLRQNKYKNWDFVFQELETYIKGLFQI